MDPDHQPQWQPAHGRHQETVRRHVVEAATDIMRNPSDSETAHPDSPSNGCTTGPSDTHAMSLYLALLQDRLPIYVRAMGDLRTRLGKSDVGCNLRSAAQATIDFYTEILAAKVSVYTRPDQVLQIRHVMRSRGLGPQAALDALASYLDGERRLGRISADAAPRAVARLLLGACVNYAFTRMVLDEVPPREEYVSEIVAGLRLDP